MSKKNKTSPKNIDALKERYKHKLNRELKFSSKRAAIIEYFINKDRHFTVEQLYNEIKKINPKIGYSTVYRTLKLLVDCGLATVHHFEEDETRFEPVHKQEHHDHLVCIKCGKIIDFTHEGIENFQKNVAKKHNFLVENHELQIYGVCIKCQKKEMKKRRGYPYGKY